MKQPGDFSGVDSNADNAQINQGDGSKQMTLREKRLRIRETGEYSKKYYLTQYVNDHGIWQEENIWKSVLQKVLNQKFQEAV